MIHGIVLRAQAKGWTSLRVNGSETFKAEAWMQATLAGLEVQGYPPKEIDRVRREERKGEIHPTHTKPRMEPGVPREPSTSRGGAEPDSLTAAQ